MLRDLSAFTTTTHLLKEASLASFMFVLEVICPVLFKRLCFRGDVGVDH